MKEYKSEQIRNVAVLGHAGDGKTTLIEGLLYSVGLIDRMGKTEEGTTAMDFDPEEQNRGISISTSLAPIEWKGAKVNFLDIPGYFDMAGEMAGALRVVDAAVIVCSATSGLAVGAEKAYKACEQNGVSRVFLISKMDRENANFTKLLSEIQDKFGTNIVPLQLPIMRDGAFVGYVDVLQKKGYEFQGKTVKEAAISEDLALELEELHETMMEAAASVDEALMEKYFEEGALSDAELISGIKAGIRSGELVPVLCGAGTIAGSIAPILNLAVDMLPAPSGTFACVNAKTGAAVQRSVSDSDKFSAFVFKTMADNFVGKISYIKVISGVLTDAVSPYNATSERTEKLNKVFTMLGKKQIELPALHAGDIGVVTKLASTNTSDTLSDPSEPVRYNPIIFPEPVIAFAISADKQGEEDKVFSGLARLAEEDPSFKVYKHPETKETLISGQGEMHLDVIASRLKSKFGVKAKLSDPRLPYRETIRKKVEAQGRHKKQSGGHGQFGDCWIRFEPVLDSGIEFEFVDAVVGGVVPKNFIPAIEKGLRESITKGVLAGYPVVGIRCTVYDGSYHAVDSSEQAFKTAARLAFRKGCQLAGPALLEPIMRVDITVPDEYMGDIIGDLNRRRGRILGMNPMSDGQQISAEVPESEMFKYATDLRSMTQARGSFHMEMARYEELPANLAQKIIDAAQKDDDEEE
ncbi:MAG: elongation factor G [Eubacteriales bacterium]|nr:elongation factor G [Eubacteriales bacterium]